MEDKEVIRKRRCIFWGAGEREKEKGGQRESESEWKNNERENRREEWSGESDRKGQGGL